MKTKTTEQVKREYRSKGVTFVSIAKEQGWRPQDIYKVLNGQIKGYRGKSHDIAVYFGLIENTQEKEMNTEPSTKQSELEEKTKEVATLRKHFDVLDDFFANSSLRRSNGRFKGNLETMNMRIEEIEAEIKKNDLVKTSQRKNGKQLIGEETAKIIAKHQEKKLTSEAFKRQQAQQIAQLLNKELADYETFVKLEILDLAQTMVSTPIQLSAYKGLKSVLRQGNAKIHTLIGNLKDKELQQP